jgi:hypothetical protein
MSVLWKALQQDNVTLRRRLGSGDPELTVILGGFLPGEGVDATFSSSPVGASRSLRNPKKDVILRGQSSTYSPGQGTGGYPGRPGGGGRPPTHEI